MTVMNAHDANTLTRTILDIARVASPVTKTQIHAVADSIGCPEWTSPEGCNGKGECWCATAARRVIELERAKA